MTKYTYEQRKIIAEYLEDSIEVMNCDHDRLVLWQKIEKLKTVTFGDIKNQVGIGFKMCGEFIYKIVKDYGSDHLLILDVKDNVIYPIEYLNDVDKVEVINE